MQRFGEKLRALRMQRGLTLRELARGLGYSNSHAYVSDFESGRRRPTLDFALKIAQYFDVSLDMLVRDDMDIPAVDEAAQDENE